MEYRIFKKSNIRKPLAVFDSKADCNKWLSELVVNDASDYVVLPYDYPARSSSREMLKAKTKCGAIVYIKESDFTNNKTFLRIHDESGKAVIDSFLGNFFKANINRANIEGIL